MGHGVFKVALAQDSFTDRITFSVCGVQNAQTLFKNTRFRLHWVTRKTAGSVIGKKASDSHIGGGCLAVSRTGVGNRGAEWRD